MANAAVKQERRREVVSDAELVDADHHMFEVRTAESPALLQQAYRLRYQVYCVENRYENPLEHPDGMEVDEFDTRSIHTVVIEHPSQQVAGTVRLILPDPQQLRTSLPIQQVCKHPILHGKDHVLTARAAEISRFSVSKQLSRRLSDRSPHLRHSEFTHHPTTALPHITLGLLKGIVRMSYEHGVDELFAVMEPTLLRLLARYGVHFTPIGSMVEYHGLRQPCHANLSELVRRVHRERVDVWEIVTECGRLLDPPAEAIAKHRFH